MQLTPYAELIALSQEDRDRKNTTTKVARQKQRGMLRLAELDEKISSLEDSIQSYCSALELQFDTIADKIDELALLTRRKEQLTTIINQLFPST